MSSFKFDMPGLVICRIDIIVQPFIRNDGFYKPESTLKYSFGRWCSATSCLLGPNSTVGGKNFSDVSA